MPRSRHHLSIETRSHACVVRGTETRRNRRSHGMADPAAHCACRRQLCSKYSRCGARRTPRAEHGPLFPRVQRCIRCTAPHLCAAPTHRSCPGSDANDVRAAKFDCSYLRHVRSVALHPFFPSHRRRDAWLMAPYPAARARKIEGSGSGGEMAGQRAHRCADPIGDEPSAIVTAAYQQCPVFQSIKHWCHYQ